MKISIIRRDGAVVFGNMTNFYFDGKNYLQLKLVNIKPMVEATVDSVLVVKLIEALESKQSIFIIKE